MRRVVARPHLIVAALIAVLVGAPGWLAPARAHAIVRETRPAADQTVGAAPGRVVMRFNEAVDIAFGALRVYDTDGRRVDRGATRHAGDRQTVEVGLEPLAQGTYTVSWRVVSADGHPVAEAFVFHVVSPGANPKGIADQLVGGQAGAGTVPGLLAGLARFAGFAGLLVLGGVVAFVAVVWRDVPARAWRLSRWAAVVVAVSAAALFVLHGPIAADLPVGRAFDAELLADVAGTRFGIAALVRIGAVAAFVLLAGPGRVRHPVVLAVPVLVALATPGLAGHAGTTPPVAVNVAADVVHTAAAAAWIGGLAVLLVAVFPALTREPGRLAEVVGRFSPLAVGSVVALVVTGVWRSYAEVRAFEAVDTAFGFVLVGKVAAFLPLLALGYANQRVVQPPFEAAGVRVLRRNVLAEAAVAAVVVALTAVLVNLPPARSELARGPVLERVHVGDRHVDLLVTPAEVGRNEVHVSVFDSAGRPADVDAVEVLFRHREKGIGPLPGTGRALAPAHFVVEGRQLSVAGRWELEVLLRSGRFAEERATVAVEIG